MWKFDIDYEKDLQMARMYAILNRLNVDDLA